MNSAVTPTPPCNGTQAEEPQENVIDGILNLGINVDPDHASAIVGEVTYRVQWYRFLCIDDTFETI